MGENAGRIVIPGGDVSRARDRFLSADGDVTQDVRQLIAASWRRCRDNAVDIDEVRVPFVPDYLHERDTTPPLLESAAPVLDALHAQLEGDAVSIILTDHAGTVLDRRTTGLNLLDRLDGVLLAPGYCYAEDHVGTNGIGTTLASGQAAFVDGREHYVDRLGLFACAGAPIRHPTRRRIVGVLDLTSWAQAPGGMLTALASATAHQIEQELLTRSSIGEFVLFQEYLKACQQPGALVFAVNGELVMMNDSVRAAFDVGEQQALLAYASDTGVTADRPVSRTVALPSGRSAHLKGIPVASRAGFAGAVFRVRVGSAESYLGASTQRRPRGFAPLPSVVGSTGAWLHCARLVVSCYEAGERMAVAGERGTGKKALLRAVHAARGGPGPVRMFGPPEPDDATGWVEEVEDALSVPGALVVLVYADLLDPALGELVTEMLLQTDAQLSPARVAITVEAPDTASSPLAPAFPRTIELPPLRHRIDDLAELVPHLLTQLSGGQRLSVSPQAMAQLRRLDWPGNVAQLRRVLAETVRLRHSGTIELADLPAEARAAGHRVLSPLEALERDAIVQALLDHSHRATAAAAALGMSRATIYRKLKLYGISRSALI